MSAGKPLHSQKVWFLYVVDHHEGPFTIDEIKQKVAKGEATQTSYVWKDPMPDWALMESEPEFGFTKGASPSIISSSQSSAAAVLGFKTATTKQNSKSRIQVVPAFLLLLFLIVAYQVVAIKKKDLGLIPLPIPTHQIQSLFKPLVAKLPSAAKRLLGGVEIPDDVAEKDREALSDAASASLEDGGRIAVTISNGEIFNPVFVLASNLPDGTNVDLVLKGKRGSLLYSNGIELKTNAVFKDQIARSQKFNLGELKALPKGEYTLVVYDSDHQSPEISLALAAAPRKAAPSLVPQGKTAFSIETYFLGGKRDAAYDAQLKEYNEKVNARITNEINELRQIEATLDSMANESATKFFKLAPKLKAAKNEWKKYSVGYMQLSSQIKNLLTAAPPAAEPGIPSRYYAEAYSAANTVYDLSERLHNTETSYFDGKTNMDQIRELAAQTLDALGKLKTTTAALGK